jgi:hypothetical protein
MTLRSEDFESSASTSFTTPATLSIQAHIPCNRTMHLRNDAGFEQQKCRCRYPNVVKVGGLQRRGGKGDAVVYYREPFTTKCLKISGLPEG